MTAPTHTCPIALSKTTSARLTLPWFVQNTEYPPRPATFEPLVNGERAFGAVYDAIMAATHTVEIICWGFQPSMYFKRDDASTLCIGDLLCVKASQGVKVRLLCWSDSLHVTAAFAENMTPGRNLASIAPLKADLRDPSQRAFDWEWYRRASKTFMSASSPTETMFPGLDPRKRLEQLAHQAFSLGKKAFENIEFATRDLTLTDRTEIAWQILFQTRDPHTSTASKAARATAMSLVPTHHQKMVLIDYEHAEQAVGFVMGHNTLDAYWDKDNHQYERMSARQGRNGATPRQDISSRVTGPVLEYLNHNFAQAWRRETGVDLLTPRMGKAADLKPRFGFGPPMMAQVLRTQIQEGARDIEKMYLQAINNATQYLYIENQYFRYKPFADAITELAKRYAINGRDPAEHGNLHLFVVTNSSKEGMGDGALNTFRMLRQLGRPDVMPGVARLEYGEESQARLKVLRAQYNAAQRKLAAYNRRQSATGFLAGPIGQLQVECDLLLEKIQKEKTNAAKEQKVISAPEICGLKVHICTLVAPDSPPDNWQEVYIHSKLMIVDDVFTTLGSANINERSMVVDSELNICVEDPAVARPLRRHLWGVHTGQEEGEYNIEKSFENWASLLRKNKERRFPITASLEKPPKASLTEFLQLSKSRKNLD
ncbi:PLD-like domain-containing protein [Pseudomonas sp. NFACC02]|uniref:phospholipase D-like domain-containing protein n=1 Tax=Pseudomonas sp. NFACC02 TaxID=1566250 RepID=UPI0008C70ACE|nr:phospholipase D-like domain-containing protein [Pseudomonas sp. NFACC02]SER47506.1 PLD-like domain-containing protein [Pseudomonas sp. NFACC02]